MLFCRQLDQFQHLEEVSPLIQETSILTNWSCRLLNSVSVIRGTCWLLTNLLSFQFDTKREYFTPLSNHLSSLAEMFALLSLKEWFFSTQFSLQLVRTEEASWIKGKTSSRYKQVQLPTIQNLELQWPGWLRTFINLAFYGPANHKLVQISFLYVPD